MKVRFHSEADVEVRESARYQEGKAPGLDVAFLAEVHRVAAGPDPLRRRFAPDTRPNAPSGAFNCRY